MPKYLGAIFFLLQLLRVECVSYAEDFNLSESQLDAYYEFASRVIPKLEYDYQKEGAFVLRYLRAKNFHVDEAEEYMLSEMKWRKDNKIETIQDEDWTDMATDYPMRLEGFDRDGRPLLLWELGDWNLSAGKMDRLLRWTFKNWDAGMRKVREMILEGKKVTRFTMVLDLKHSNSKTNVYLGSLPYYIKAALAYDSHFPELGDRIFLVNSSSVFDTVLSIVKPRLKQSTKDSLIVVKDPKVLFDAIDPSELPTRYGGTKVDKSIKRPAQ